MKRLKSIVTVVIIFLSGMIVGGIGGSAATMNELVNSVFRDGPVKVRRTLVKHAKHELRLDDDQAHQFWQVLNETGLELRDASEPVLPKYDPIIGRSELRLRQILRSDQQPRFDAFMQTARTRWGKALYGVETPGGTAEPAE